MGSWSLCFVTEVCNLECVHSHCVVLLTYVTWSVFTTTLCSVT